MKYLSYSLALALIILAGCSKDEPEATLVLNGDYVAGNTVATAPIVMYTKDGAVNNAALIDRFLSRRSWASSSFSRTDVAIPANNSLTLSIRGNTQATLINTSAGRVDTLKCEVTSRVAKYAVLSARDSASGYSSSNSTRCDQLSGQMQLEVPAKRCRSIPATAGFSQICWFRPIRLIKIEAGQLFIPQFSWIIQSSQLPYTYCGQAYGGLWNVFNPAVRNQLAAGDTVVVQERSVALLRK